jgi:hypothetical protein
MSLETQVQNLATETARRWKTLRGRSDAVSRQATRDLLAKLACGTWLLAGNLLRAGIGRRVQPQVLTIRQFQRRMVDTDETRLLAMLDHAVEAVLWHLVVARRDGLHLRRVERMVAEFIDTAEGDLVKLNRMAKA